MNNIISIILKLISTLFHIKTDSTVDAQSLTPIISEPLPISIIASPVIIPLVPATPTLNLPARPSNAMTGSQFSQSIFNMTTTQAREDIIFSEFQKGNVPNFMRTLSPVTVKSGNDVLTYYVTPDFLCIGSDDDFLRMPMFPGTGVKIGQLCNCILPTKFIADCIFNSSDLRLNPQPNPGPYDASMGSLDRIVFNNTNIEAQRAGRSYKIIEGIKKNILVCSNLKQGNECIYGWFYPNGTPIQGKNSTSHSATYTDYSNCVRLIYNIGTLNGNQVNLSDIIDDTLLCHLLSDEGSFDINKCY